MSTNWRTWAKNSQQSFAVSLGNRMWYKYIMPTDEKDLWDAIAYTLVGPPEYTEQQKEKISEIKDKCIGYCQEQGRSEVYIGLLFVSTYKPDILQATMPVIKVKYCDGRQLTDSHIIDHCGHVYDTWAEFLNENVLNGWWICVPKGGEYSFSSNNEVELEFYDQTQCSAVVQTFQTGISIIKEAQHAEIAANKKAVSPENRDAFDQMHQARQEMVEPGKDRTMHGNEEFICDLKRINNITDYFKAFTIEKGNQLNVNQELVIDAKAFLQMTETERAAILEHSEALRHDRITLSEFEGKLGSIYKEYCFGFERRRATCLSTLQEVFGVSSFQEVKVGGKKIFENLQPHEIDRLHQVFTQAGKKYKPDCAKIAHTMASRSECSNVTEFTAVMEYAIRQVDQKALSLKAATPNPSKPPGMKDKDFFFKQAADLFFNDHEYQNHIVESFWSLHERCDAANSSGYPRFGNSMAATNHYDKHPDFPKYDPHNNLTPERYFELGSEMCAGPLTDSKWTQDGQSLWGRFRSEEFGAVAIRYDNLANGTSVIATLMSESGDIQQLRICHN